MSFRIPIFIHAGIGKSAESPDVLLNRWDNYGQRVKVATGGKQPRIVVFLPDSIYTSSFSAPTNLKIVSFKDSFFGRIKLVFSLSQYIKLGSNPVTLVAGDLFISPIIANLAKRLSKPSVRVQIQFHGATYKEKVVSLRSFVRVALMRCSIRASDSIRVVSHFQIAEIQRITNSENKYFVVAPIPVNQKKISVTRAKHDVLAILVLGRLHRERGVDDFSDFLSLLNSSHFTCSINVVGEGPLLEELSTFSQTLNKDLKIRFHGRLDESGVREQLSVNDVLLSFAPEEGYGLAIREALLSGMVVIARRNLGTTEVKKSHPEAIELFDSVPEAVELIESLIPSNPTQEYLLKLRKAHEDTENQRIEDLVASWVKP